MHPFRWHDGPLFRAGNVRGSGGHPDHIVLISDNTDFTNAHKGFIAPLPQEIIKGEQGNVIWDPQQYAFIKEGDKAPDSVNPSLWRQSQVTSNRPLILIS